MDDSSKSEWTRIRALRLSRGWTQEELACAAGLSTRSVQRAEESACHASLETRKAIAAALDVSVDDLAHQPSQLFVLGPTVLRRFKDRGTEWTVKVPEGVDPPVSLSDIERQLFELDKVESLLKELEGHGWHLVGRDFREGNLHGLLVMVVPKTGSWQASVQLRS